MDCQFVNLRRKKKHKWHAQSKLLAKTPDPRRPGNSWQTKLHARLPTSLIRESKRDTGSVQARSPWEKSENSRSLLSFWFESCRSSVLWERSHRSTSQIFASRAKLSSQCRRHAKHTWLACSKTPICAQSMRNVWRSCPRTFSWQDASVVRESDINWLKLLLQIKNKNEFSIKVVCLNPLKTLWWVQDSIQ